MFSLTTVFVGGLCGIKDKNMQWNANESKENTLIPNKSLIILRKICNVMDIIQHNYATNYINKRKSRKEDKTLV